jgi:UPF0755 protein
MRGDILPPKRPLSHSLRQTPPLNGRRDPVGPRPLPTTVTLPPIEPRPTQLLLEKPKRRSLKRIIGWSLGIIVGLAILLVIGVYLWYMAALRPVSGSPAEKTRIHIVQGSSLSDIGRLLEEKKLIQSYLAFDLYTRLSGVRSGLQAGVYSLAPSQSTEEIVTHLVSGTVEELSITFLPGATLAENRTELLKAGYTSAEVDAALEKSYNHPLFAGKPASADLEGYIYGETYTFASNATVEQILERTFDEFYVDLEENNLIAGFKKRGLSLFEAITLASIIQREVPGTADQKQVAQVFFQRLSIDMELGADATYKYAAKKLGVAPSPDLDSPYNTRKYPGLPPGPIATAGLTALQAVASPARGDYLYFVSGDNEKTYFSHTFEEHEANIRDHCKVKCSLP